MVPSINRNLYIFLYMFIAIPLAGELNFYPFNDYFRVSFGMPTFFLFLFISRKKIPAVTSGIIVGAAVVIFRILLDLPFHDISYAFQHRYPTFFYYLVFGSLFQFTQAGRYVQQSILIGIMGCLFDIFASIGELTFQYIAFDSITTRGDIQKISIIAIFRSYFTVGFLNLLILYRTRLREEEVQRQNDKLTIVVSNLYEESINLHKTLVNSEKVTKDAYHLYILLKDTAQSNAGNQPKQTLQPHHMALEIAGKIHEIKKDNQRIFAGLSRLITEKEFLEYMDMNKLLNITLESNGKYANWLEKDIEFIADIQGEHPKYHAYQVLSIFNNLIANAVESIKTSGKIIVKVRRDHDMVEFQIKDNGPGIAEDKLQLIFKPGFTNKYENNGKSFTGIGLTYVKGLVEGLEGHIILQSNGEEKSGLICKIQLPIKKLIQKG